MDRIGCRQEGAEEIKNHPFFNGMDWEKLFNKEVQPPFVPDVSTEDDVSKIDPEFLAEVPHETPAENSALMKTLAEETNFDNFTFVNENNLSRIGSEIDQNSHL